MPGDFYEEQVSDLVWCGFVPTDSRSARAPLAPTLAPTRAVSLAAPVGAGRPFEHMPALTGLGGTGAALLMRTVSWTCASGGRAVGRDCRTGRSGGRMGGRCGGGAVGRSDGQAVGGEWGARSDGRSIGRADVHMEFRSRSG